MKAALIAAATLAALLAVAFLVLVLVAIWTVDDAVRGRLGNTAGVIGTASLVLGAAVCVVAQDARRR